MYFIRCAISHGFHLEISILLSQSDNCKFLASNHFWVYTATFSWIVVFSLLVEAFLYWSLQSFKVFSILANFSILVYMDADIFAPETLWPEIPASSAVVTQATDYCGLAASAFKASFFYSSSYFLVISDTLPSIIPM